MVISLGMVLYIGKVSNAWYGQIARQWRSKVTKHNFIWKAL